MEENPRRDLAGHVVKFTNPDAKPGEASGFPAYQERRVGGMMASRKVKVGVCAMDDLGIF